MQPHQTSPQSQPPRPFMGDIRPPSPYQSSPSQAPQPASAPLPPSTSPYTAQPAPVQTSVPPPQPAQYLQPLAQPSVPAVPSSPPIPPQPDYPQTAPLQPASIDGMVATATPRPSGGYNYYGNPQPGPGPASSSHIPLPPEAPTMASVPPQAHQPTFNPASLPPAPQPAQIVETIPVRAPNQSFAPHQPAHSPQFSPHESFALQSKSADDMRIEQILKDVNGSVQVPDKSPKTGQLPWSKPSLGKVAPKLKTATHMLSKPVLPLGVAMIIFIGLVAASYFAFGNNGSSNAPQPGLRLVGTSAAAGDSIKAGGGLLVSPTDMDDFSKTLQSQVNGLNDNQDFNNSDLSDHALGL